MHTVFITGAAGYVGAMLVERFAARPDVEKVIGLDKEPMPDSFKSISKLTYIHANTADAWEGEIGKYAPDIIVHTAWQIREIYGDHALTWKWNIDGSDNVFDFAFSNAYVDRLNVFRCHCLYP